MKVYNLTDVETPTLVSRQMVNVPIMVEPGLVVLPGQHVEVTDRQATRAYLEQTFCIVGALALGRPPEGYQPKAAVQSVPTRRARRPAVVEVEAIVEVVPEPAKPADGSEG